MLMHYLTSLLVFKGMALFVIFITRVDKDKKRKKD